VVTISITAEAYAAISSTLPKGVRAEARLDEGGGFKITLDRHTLDGLAALRGQGESYSDVIVRLTTAASPASAQNLAQAECPPSGGRLITTKRARSKYWTAASRRSPP
jgi:hypothetical protein